MGDQDREQQLRAARGVYIAAVRQLDRALRAFDASGMPMDPGPDPDHPYPWNRGQVEVISAVAEAFPAVVRARREWDTLRRG